MNTVLAYILIAFFRTSLSESTMVTMEFTSKDNCEFAVTQIEQMISSRLFWRCLPK